MPRSYNASCSSIPTSGMYIRRLKPPTENSHQKTRERLIHVDAWEGAPREGNQKVGVHASLSRLRSIHCTLSPSHLLGRIRISSPGNTAFHLHMGPRVLEPLQSIRTALLSELLIRETDLRNQSSYKRRTTTRSTWILTFSRHFTLSEVSSFESSATSWSSCSSASLIWLSAFRCFMSANL